VSPARAATPRRINALFVCSRNRWRSPTAERVWRDSVAVNVRARGVSPKAERVVREEDVRWADVVFVMERGQRNKLVDRFPGIDRDRIVVLDIPDAYQFMDPELVALLQDRAGPYLAQVTDSSDRLD
jgi:predicted protein tyrosine phosphatase